jgi:hypothetical protein
VHFNAGWNAISTIKKDDNGGSAVTVDAKAFNPEPNARQRHPDMQVSIARNPDTQSTTIPVVTAYPIPEDRERLIEALSKRARVVQGAAPAPTAE